MKLFLLLYLSRFQTHLLIFTIEDTNYFNIPEAVSIVWFFNCKEQFNKSI
jgi:hypothetical protein